MHVTVVMMCKGRLHHLKQSLPAVLGQKGVTFSVTLVDYACPERAGDWAESLGDSRVKVVRVQPGTDRYNAAHAHNVGAAHSEGDLLVFVDADVILNPAWLSHVLDLFKSEPEAVLCQNRGGPGFERSQWGLCAVRAEAFTQVRGYDEAIDRWGKEDTDFFQRVTRLGRTVNYDNALVRCIEHSEAESTRYYPQTDKSASELFVTRYLSTRRGSVNPFGWGRAIPETRGVITAADETYFPGVKLLFRSLSATEIFPLTCVDLGLTQAQRRWCVAQGVGLIPYEALGIPADVVRAFGGADPKRERWGNRAGYVWFKPWYAAASPYTLTAWIDADAVALRPLSGLFALTRGGAVLTRESYRGIVEHNAPGLYEALPVESVDPELSLNSGVLVFRRGRDEGLLSAWRECVTAAADKPSVRSQIACHDQGALTWAAHKTRSVDRVTKDVTWNFAGRAQWSGGCGCSVPSADTPSLFTTLRRQYPNVGIAHWMGPSKLWHMLKPSAQKAMIVFRPRSGSHMLESQLEAHPRVRWLGELLNPWIDPDLVGVKLRRQAEVAHKRVWAQAGEASVIGFRWDVSHACREHLVSDTEVKVILLRRQNALEREVSWMQAQLSREWAITHPSEAPVEITARIRPQWMLRRFEEHDGYHERVRAMFVRHPFLEVTYEDLRRNPAEWLRVANFLDIEPTEWSPRTLKQERRTMRDVIQNFDELMSYFEGTKYGWMFAGELAAELN